MILLEFYNENTGEGFTFGRAPLFYNKIGGLATFESDTTSFKIPNVDGYRRQYSTINERQITIEGKIKASTKLAITKIRRKLIANFHCKHNNLYTLKAMCEDRKEYFIKCFCERGIELEDTQETGLDYFILPYKITLVCPDPYWKQEEIYRAKYASIEGKFFFDLEIDANDPEDQIFGEIIKREKIKIENKGDVPTGFTIICEGKNTDFIKISDANDQNKFILIKKGTEPGEKIVINCLDGNKSIRFFDDQNVDVNAFKYLDENSTFWKLDVGDNFLVIETGNSGDDQDITVEFKALYAGV